MQISNNGRRSAILVNDMDITYLKSVGPRRAQLLGRMGIGHARDLLWHIPRRYRSIQTCLAEANAGDVLVIEGRVGRAQWTGRPPHIVVLETSQGTVELVWFRGRSSYLARQYAPGKTLCIAGGLGWHQGRPRIAHPRILPDALAGQSLEPIYPQTEGLDNQAIRQIFARNRTTLLKYAESSVLPDDVARTYRLPGLRESFERLHFPRQSDAEVLGGGRSRWHKRLLFEELFSFEMGCALAFRQRTAAGGIRVQMHEGPISERLERLSTFSLTGSQVEALRDIAADLNSELPMNRLLQGDVGCGKTLVALGAMLGVIDAGWQAALMAPTDVLARQHYQQAQKLLGQDIHVGLLVGTLSAADIRKVLEACASGKMQMLFGTHALVQDRVEFAQLGLAVIDEQHRFGVEQRAALGRRHPGVNQLFMSATPIPRTLALTLFADMHLTSMRDRPRGRQEVRTEFWHAAKESRVIDLLRHQIDANGQIYVVVPRIEPGEESDLESAESLHARLLAHFGSSGVELAHGRMDNRARDAAMERFITGESAILVATTLIEVGVDNPRATCMLIYHPERFGLSQLHQLRGRIGRGERAGFCVLYAPRRVGEQARQRAQALCEMHDGFAIAERDLELRGPGDVLGVRQSGMPEFRVADPAQDTRALEFAHREVQRILEEDPALEAPQHAMVRGFFQALAPERRMH